MFKFFFAVIRSLGAAVMMSLLIASAGDALAQATSTQDGGQTSADNASTGTPGSDDADGGSNDDPVWGYFLGKTGYIFFHELTLALSRQPEMRGELATSAKRDQLTAVLLVAEAHKRFGSTALGDAVAGWIVSWRQAQRDDVAASAGPDDTRRDNWDARNVTPAQLSALLCILYGSDPQHYHALIESGDVQRDASGDCIKNYQQLRATWSAALQHGGISLVPATNGAAVAAQAAQSVAPLTLEQRPSDAPDLTDFISWLGDIAIIENLATETNRDLAFAASIKIVLLQCNSKTEAAEVPSGEMHLCYELLKSVYDTATAQNVEAPPE
jgi:hypothetical protein